MFLFVADFYNPLFGGLSTTQNPAWLDQAPKLTTQIREILPNAEIILGGANLSKSEREALFLAYGFGYFPDATETTELLRDIDTPNSQWQRRFLAEI